MRSMIAAAALLTLSACTMTSTPSVPYTVFFSKDSADIATDAAGIIAQAAAAAKAAPAAHVTVLGYTGNAGSAAADMQLSQRRAQAVADALVADGIPATRITQQGRGQTGENPSEANRRVDIEIGH